MKPLIVTVEDDLIISELVEFNLINEGYDVKYFDLVSKLHYSDYSKEEVEKTYRKLILRTKTEGKLSISTKI